MCEKIGCAPFNQSVLEGINCKASPCNEKGTGLLEQEKQSERVKDVQFECK